MRVNLTNITTSRLNHKTTKLLTTTVEINTHKTTSLFLFFLYKVNNHQLYIGVPRWMEIQWSLSSPSERKAWLVLVTLTKLLNKSNHHQHHHLNMRASTAHTLLNTKKFHVIGILCVCTCANKVICE